MRILMLGWEFPPFISGGLGVACYGLTRALDRAGHHVVFVLPKPVDRSHASHVTMLSPMNIVGMAGGPNGFAMPMVGGVPIGHALGPAGVWHDGPDGFDHTRFLSVRANFSHPYPSDAQRGSSTFHQVALHELGMGRLAGDGGEDPALDPALEADLARALASAAGGKSTGPSANFGYGNDLIGDAERYARLVVALTRREQFDVIHAHDWLTYPAGIALARVTGKPLVVQVHSTEFDRSGQSVNQRVYDIERAGMHAASRVIAVSQLTKSICQHRYGVPAEKVDVVYNGIERDDQQPSPQAAIESDDKVVLFLGRITMQKGPEYFIAAAKRVLEKVPKAKFVLAGSGDMAIKMIELAAEIGIGSKVLFTGFLRGNDVERVFQMADCYVMPSVSEPFGIAALEAINHDVPVVLSKTSGASEVLTHVLKVDFWDIDEMANKIVAILRHPPLSQTLRSHGKMELHRLTWDEAAVRCGESYAAALRVREASASA